MSIDKTYVQGGGCMSNNFQDMIDGKNENFRLTNNLIVNLDTCEVDGFDFHPDSTLVESYTLQSANGLTFNVTVHKLNWIDGAYDIVAQYLGGEETFPVAGTPYYTEYAYARMTLYTPNDLDYAKGQIKQTIETMNVDLTE
ncbi:MAG: hypothetical protein Q9M91_00135 [Candidatus Dojkabacteria bacterium]|nr:hypothetical protein [Candidatus Dojkabacteria bacterium]MDQ7020240.1 hypothetical protein [Candidatus Dojkabacteria bacterium]